eukprot:1013661-Prorocentrum_lima.AAC.1
MGVKSSSCRIFSTTASCSRVVCMRDSSWAAAVPFGTSSRKASLGAASLVARTIRSEKKVT